MSYSVAADTGQNSRDEIVLYGIYPTSGDLADKGLDGKASASLAVENMNNLYAEIGSDRIVTLKSTDISSDPESTLSAVKAIHESGVNLIIGTLSSSQLQAIKPYADANGVVIISTGSSATSLSLPDDNIFRINPDDSSEESVLNSLLQMENINVIVPLVREDSWDNFQSETILGKPMKSLGSDEVVRYNPGSDDYTEIVSSLDSLVGSVLEHEDSDSVSVMAFTFDDIVPIMEEASNPAYPNLSLVQWMGSDANTCGQNLLKSEKAANFALGRNYSGYTLKKNLAFSSEIPLLIQEKLGCEPDGYAYAAYDMAVLAAQVLFMHGDSKAEQLRRALIAVTDIYYGVTGSLNLNSAGDKVRSDYGFNTIGKDESGNFVWKSTGDWVKWSDTAVPSVRFIDNMNVWNPVTSSE